MLSERRILDIGDPSTGEREGCSADPAPTASTAPDDERTVTIPARPWPTARRSDTHGASRRRASRLRIPALLLLGAAVAVALVPAPGTDTRPIVGLLLLLAAAAFARILADTSRSR